MRNVILILAIFFSVSSFAASITDRFTKITANSINDTLYNLVTNGTGTGGLVLKTAPTFLTQLTTPSLILSGSGSGTITVNPPANPTPHSVILPATVCSSGQVWTDNGSGVMSCASMSGGTYVQEIPSGTANGSNTAFTLAYTPVSDASVSLYLDGIQMQQGAGKDYTISGLNITMLSAPAYGQYLNATYVK